VSLFLLENRMITYELNSIKEKEPFPGCKVRFVHSENMTFAYWTFTAGATLPSHSHVHEQVGSIIQGEMDLTVDGETKRLAAGSVVVIPSNAKHSVKTITECYVVDVFYPVREDYR